VLQAIKVLLKPEFICSLLHGSILRVSALCELIKLAFLVAENMAPYLTTRFYFDPNLIPVRNNILRSIFRIFDRTRFPHGQVCKG